MHIHVAIVPCHELSMHAEEDFVGKYSTKVAQTINFACTYNWFKWSVTPMFCSANLKFFTYPL